jgi:hypothetical protein
MSIIAKMTPSSRFEGGVPGRVPIESPGVRAFCADNAKAKDWTNPDYWWKRESGEKTSNNLLAAPADPVEDPPVVLRGRSRQNALVMSG